VSSVFISDPFIAEVNKASSPEQIRDYLQDAGITHIFINWWEVLRKGNGGSLFSKKGQETFDVFASKYLRVVFRNQISAPAPVEERQTVDIDELIKDLKIPERPRVPRSPKTALDYEMNGLELMRQEQYAQAVDSFRISVQINPNVADYRANLGSALVSLGKIDEAVVQYRSALSIDPKKAALHRNFGVLLAKQGKLTEAVKELQVALVLDPNDQLARNNLELTLRLQQK
jgi:tetratricopeptide (TPR) repeat protein